jgi:hypothetical protein
MLVILIKRAKTDGQIEGVIPHLVDDGLSILQYADNIILFMEHDLEKVRNMKLLLNAFEELSGLKINFYKSEIFRGRLRNLNRSMNNYSVVRKDHTGSDILGFQCILNNKDWKMIGEKIEKKLSS